MPAVSKFREPVRARILEVLRAGGSRRQAARVAGIDPRTLRRWIERGATADPLGRWHEFHRDVREAESCEPRPQLLEDESRAPFVDLANPWPLNRGVSLGEEP
jgi:hypothetical protein